MREQQILGLEEEREMECQSVSQPFEVSKLRLTRIEFSSRESNSHLASSIFATRQKSNTNYTLREL